MRTRKGSNGRQSRTTPIQNSQLKIPERTIKTKKNVEDKLLTNTAVKQENDSTSTVQEIQFKINKGTQGEDGERA